MEHNSSICQREMFYALIHVSTLFTGVLVFQFYLFAGRTFFFPTNTKVLCEC